MLKSRTKAPSRTAEIIAAKLRRALSLSPNIKPADVARACTVSPQAVNGWKSTGRISKDNLPKVAEITGTTLEWRMDGNPESEPVLAAFARHPNRPQTAQQPLAFYSSEPDINRLVDAFRRLFEADRQVFLQAIEERARQTDASFARLSARKDSPTAAAIFKPAVPDEEVARRMKLREHPSK